MTGYRPLDNGNQCDGTPLGDGLNQVIPNMHERRPAETECQNAETGEPGAEIRRQIAALYVRLAHSIAAALTGDRVR